MKELDVVRLTEEFKGLPAGTEGTIVLEYDGTCFEVEFFDDEGDTIDVLMTPANVLRLCWEYVPMSDKVICEKCGAEMEPIDKNTPVGMTCPECGWGWATTYIDPLLEDSETYEVVLAAGNKQSEDVIAAVADIAGCNFLRARQLVAEAPVTVFSGDAPSVKDAAEKLESAAADYEIKPDFPHEIRRLK
ncbi:MAG: DUF4926 domain-containing protein [Abditibacteriota bacterium]|nr:DUF4926 domain-containing protein [Abditibacteriota bacterium]MBP5737856.1 DUF4926 domain-containing protein [Abditibacteriota bacterium]